MLGGDIGRRAPQDWAYGRGAWLSLLAELPPPTPSLLSRPFVPGLSQLHFSLLVPFCSSRTPFCPTGTALSPTSDSPSLFTPLPWDSLWAAGGPSPLLLSLDPLCLYIYFSALSSFSLQPCGLSPPPTCPSVSVPTPPFPLQGRAPFFSLCFLP
uniref:Uncharacterized protein n=1 Tax=Rousettus aegyptiacus TaxID=9407 RepID=A0A7J8GBB1_ROUAE|nr:hypothetical protein HJG63_011676 [Rousettus aegyptiacus]